MKIRAAGIAGTGDVPAVFSFADKCLGTLRRVCETSDVVFGGGRLGASV